MVDDVAPMDCFLKVFMIDQITFDPFDSLLWSHRETLYVGSVKNSYHVAGVQ
jgi:hypothetical protein